VAPGAQASAPPTTVSNRGGPSFGPGTILALLGAAAIVVSIFVAWFDYSKGAVSTSANAGDVPVQFLVDNQVEWISSISIIVLLAPAAALLVIGALVAKARVLGVIGGAVAIIVTVLYSIQWQRIIDDKGMSFGLTDLIGIGVYVAVVGGIVGLVGSLLPRR